MDFKNAGTEDVYNNDDTKAARRTLPTNLHEIARRKMSMLRGASNLNQLRVPLGNDFEALTGDRLGQYSIRINRQYRICFTWIDEASNLEITDYH